MKSFFRSLVIRSFWGSFILGLLSVQSLEAQETPQSIARYFYEQLLENTRDDFQGNLKLYVVYLKVYEDKLSPKAVEISKEAVLGRIDRLKDRIETTSSNIKNILDAFIQDEKLFLTQSHLRSKQELETLGSVALASLDQFKIQVEKSPSTDHKYLLEATQVYMESFVAKIDEMMKTSGILYTPSLWAGQTTQSLAQYFYRKILEVTKKEFETHLKLFESFLDEGKLSVAETDDQNSRTVVSLRCSRIAERMILSIGNIIDIINDAYVDQKLIHDNSKNRKLGVLWFAANDDLEAFEQILDNTLEIPDPQHLLDAQTHMKEVIQKMNEILEEK